MCQTFMCHLSVLDPRFLLPFLPPQSSCLLIFFLLFLFLIVGFCLRLALLLPNSAALWPSCNWSQDSNQQQGTFTLVMLEMLQMIF